MKEGYKKTELGWIPNEWEINKLSSISEIIMGQSPDSNSYNDEKIGIPFFQGKTEFGRINPIVKKWCSNPIKISQPQDVLISVRAPVGEVNINIEESCIGRGLAAIRQKNCDYKFLFYYMQKIKNRLNLSAQGSTFTAINSGDLKNISIITPPLEEQQKIADILSTVDAQIDDTDNLIEKTKELKKGLMQRLLTKGIGHSEFKKSEIGEIPVEWHVDNIGSICNLINGRAFKPKEWMESGIPIIRIQNLNGSDEYNYYDGEIDEKYMIKNGDLLFSWSGSRGTSFGPHIWCKIDGVLNQHIFRVDLKEGLDKRFIYYSLKNITMKIEQEAHGSAGLVHITKGALEKINISLPIIEEQEKIANILSSVDNQIEEFEIKKEKLKEVKKGLMQQLLTGKIRVK